MLCITAKENMLQYMITPAATWTKKKTLRVSAVNDNGVCGLCAKGTELLSSRESLSSDLTNYKLLGLGARWTL